MKKKLVLLFEEIETEIKYRQWVFLWISCRRACSTRVYSVFQMRGKYLRKVPIFMQK